MAMAQSMGALSAQNPAQELEADFTRQGMDVRSGQAHWRLALAGYGYGDRLEKVEGAAPQTQANRVEYRRGPLVEWYVNGPAGLEQGFTLRAPPALGTRDAGHGARATGYGVRGTGHGAPNSSPLTIALQVGGDLAATVDLPASGQEGARAVGLTLHDSQGQAILRYTGLTAHDASGRALVAWLELGKDEVRLRVDDAGARYPVVVDPFIQQAELTPSDGAAYEEFGTSVAVSSDGSTIVAGAAFATIGSNYAQGAAYVFVKPGAAWATMTQTAKLTASGGAAHDELGTFVGVSSDGSTIVAGAPGSNSFSGAAYVFVMPVDGWVDMTQTAKLTASDGGITNWFGNSVGINSDGSTIVAGAYSAGSGANSYPGAAYVFVMPGGGWVNATQTAKLTASDGASGDGLGYSVGVGSDGSTIVAGTPNATVGSNHYQGAAYVFVKPGGGWANATQTAKLTASDGAAYDAFGTSVGVSSDGSTIVAGAPQPGDISSLPSIVPGRGAAYVFVKPGGGWATMAQTAELTASDGVGGDALGWSVGVSGDGNTIVAGAPNASIGSIFDQGAAYLFVWRAGGWATTSTFTAKLAASDAKDDDELGWSVGVSNDGSTILAGAIYAKYFGPGAAYVFLATPSASLSVTSLSFGTQAAGTTSIPQTVSLTNDGNAPLYVTSVAATSGYSTTTECVTASPLAVGASCSEAVTFDPASAGALSGTLTFTDDSGSVAGSTQTVSLSGTGALATTTTSINVVAPSPSMVGEVVTVGFVVAPQADETLTPSGTVTVNASTGESCTGSAPSGYCSLTFLSAGTRTITASYGGETNIFGSSISSPAVSQSVTAANQAPLIVIGPASVTYGTPGTATAAGGSGTGALSFSAIASTGCSVSGATVSVTNITGTCWLVATKAGDNNYLAESSAPFAVTLVGLSQTISFTQTAPAEATYQSTFPVAAQSTSGLRVVLTVAAGSDCSLGGRTTLGGVTSETVTMLRGSGTCTIDANQAGNFKYSAAAQQQTSAAGQQVGQTISFTSPAPTEAIYKSTFPVAAESTSGLRVTLSVDAGSAGVCSLGTRTTVSGVTSATVTMLKGAGTCTLDANQVGNTDYSAAAEQQTSAAAQPAGQTITFTTPAPSTASVNSTFPVAAGSSSGRTVALSVDAGSSGVCKLGPRTTVSGVTSATVTMLKSTGTCTLDANQAGNADYSAAAQVSTSAAATP